jgi:hypothetical protein
MTEYKSKSKGNLYLQGLLLQFRQIRRAVGVLLAWVLTLILFEAGYLFSPNHFLVVVSYIGGYWIFLVLVGEGDTGRCSGLRWLLLCLFVWNSRLQHQNLPPALKISM